MPANSGWSRDPWQATFVGDRLYGLGAADTKGAIAAAVIAAEAAAAAGKLDGVGLLFSGDEEHGTAAVRAFLASEVSRSVEYAIVCEPTARRAGLAHRGVLASRARLVGTGGLVASGVFKTVLFIFVSPVLGFLLGSLMMVVVAWVCRRAAPSRVDRWFRRLQLVSAGAYSLGHGGNDAQKTIGIIWMLLIATGYTATTEAAPPTWVIVSCYTAIAAGTMFGGWRIVKTMGQKITKLKPVGGFCAETGGAMTLFLATALGIPVSTTHTITGAIVGVGSTQRASAVRWGVAGNIVWAWVLTIPASAFVAAIAYWASLQIF